MADKHRRKHRLSGKFTVIAIFGWFLLAQLFESVPGNLLKSAGLFGDADTPKYLGYVIGAVLFMIFMKIWYSPEYKGILKPGVTMKQTLLFTLPVLIYTVIIVLMTGIQNHFYWKNSMTNVLMALSAGFGEEAVFRVSMIPVSMGFFKSRQRVWAVPVITAVLFGIMHLGNILAGATVTNSVVQAIVTAFAGFYYGALFAGTGSAFPGILTHALYDYTCFAGDPGLTNGVMTTQLGTWEMIVNIILAAALAAGGVFILKKLGNTGVLNIWKTKWSQEQVDSEFSETAGG